MPEIELFEKGHRACAGCGCALAIRYALKASGPDTIVCHNTGCMEVISTPYPETAWKVPWIHVAFENAAAVASGVKAALLKLKKSTNVLVIAGDGGTFDIGLQALSGAFERGHHFCYICYDNNAYMNCLSTSSMIMTESGLKKITEVKKNEKIYAFDQKSYNLVLKKCIGVFDNGIKDVYELSTLHHSIKATSNHPFLVLKRNDRGKSNNFIWKKLEDVKVGDEVVVLKGLNGLLKSKKFNIQKVKKGDYKVNKLNEVNLPKSSSVDVMKYIGLYIGDGWIREKKGEIGFALPENKTGRKELIALHKRIFGSKLNASDKVYVMMQSVNICKFIKSLGIGIGAKNKTIPNWMFTLPLKEKEALLEGLMLSDGYKIGNSCRYVSGSEYLLKSLRLLLQTMGRRVGKIHWQIKKKGTNVCNRELLKDSKYGYICFSNRKQLSVTKYLSQHKYRNFLIQNNYFETENVVNIKLMGKEPTLDLRIEGEHNFIADGIVVHNTGIQRSGATPKYTDTTTTPAGKVIHGKLQNKKPMPLIVAAHGAYVATANVAYPVDFYNKVKKGLAYNGPSYIQVFAPCVVGWKYPPNLSIDVCKMAFQTKVTPLYEINDGILTFTSKPSQPRPVAEFLRMQGWYKHLTDQEIQEIQKYTDEEFDKLLKLEETKIKI